MPNACLFSSNYNYTNGWIKSNCANFFLHYLSGWKMVFFVPVVWKSTATIMELFWCCYSRDGQVVPLSSFGSEQCQRVLISLSCSYQAHSSGCEHSSPTDLLFKRAVCSGEPITEKLACREEEGSLNSLFQGVCKLKCCTKAQYKKNKDHFELWLIQSYSGKVQELKYWGGKEHNRSPLHFIEL